MAREEPSVLWEDEQIVVINKPSFWVVNRAESVGEETMQDWIEKKFSIFPEKYSGSRVLDSFQFSKNEETEAFRKRSGVAHRLDKETSGCLLVAKTPVALAALLLQFQNRSIRKEYLALVHGRVEPKEGAMRLPLARGRHDREKWEVRYSGKMAETAWRVEKYYTQNSELGGWNWDVLTLVRLFPKTGRTHQIRVHLAHMGFPIFADEKYLTKSKIALDRELLSHHFLHAEKLGFVDMAGVTREVMAPLPNDAEKLLRWLV